jgi:NO-binding membrane sensor protein with MHYT domain
VALLDVHRDGTAALWAALRLTTVGSALIASLIMGVAVSGMHYTGIAAMHGRRPAAAVIRRTSSHLCISVRKSGIALRDGACAPP